MRLFLVSLAVITASVCTAQSSTTDAWINEIHYDESTSYGDADANEFIEVALRTIYAANPTELAKYKIVLYSSGAIDASGLNAGRGLPYNVSSSWYTEAETIHALTGFTSCAVTGTPITLLSKALPILQDLPAAIALVYENTVVQLLSYEKIFKIETSARAGVASGMLTTLINRGNTADPAMETASTASNHSISLMGSGDRYSSFSWDDGLTVTGTPCAPNTNGISTQNFLVPLPVRFISLAATGNRNMINIQWKVAPGSTADRYEVELASANNAFTRVAQVAASGNANGSYQSQLSNVDAGIYTIRIKSIFNTDSFEYSESKLVRLTNGNNALVNVYPNPVKGGNLNLFITPSNRQTYTIQLVDVAGKIVQTRQTSILEAGSSNAISLNVSNIISGIYYLKLLSANDKQIIKVVVAK